jgi:hypothetical protein
VVGSRAISSHSGNKELIFPGIPHAWGDAWLSFDGVNKVKAVSLTLTLEIKLTGKGGPANWCQNCDSISADAIFKCCKLNFPVAFEATAQYRGADGKLQKLHQRLEF